MLIPTSSISYYLMISVICIELTITPLSLYVTKGGTAEFTATASDRGTTKFTYQWKKRYLSYNYGVEKKLTISDITVADGGQYFCVVTNEWGRTQYSANVKLIYEGNYVVMYSNMLIYVTKLSV